MYVCNNAISVVLYSICVLGHPDVWLCQAGTRGHWSTNYGVTLGPGINLHTPETSSRDTPDWGELTCHKLNMSS